MNILNSLKLGNLTTVIKYLCLLIFSLESIHFNYAKGSELKQDPQDNNFYSHSLPSSRTHSERENGGIPIQESLPNHQSVNPASTYIGNQDGFEYDIQQSSGLMQLPQELFYEICNFLSYSDIKRLALANKALDELTQDTCLNRFGFSNKTPADFERLVLHINNNNYGVEIARFVNFNFNKTHLLTLTQLLSLPLGAKLRYLDFDDCTFVLEKNDNYRIGLDSMGRYVSFIGNRYDLSDSMPVIDNFFNALGNWLNQAGWDSTLGFQLIKVPFLGIDRERNYNMAIDISKIINIYIHNHNTLTKETPQFEKKSLLWGRYYKSRVPELLNIKLKFPVIKSKNCDMPA